MVWFLIALIGPFLYALTNHIDKVLLGKYFKAGGVGTLILFSALLSALALPVLLIIDPMVLDVSLVHFLFLALVGVLNIIVLWCYLLALKDEEASITVVFYQLVPLFGYLLGYLVLDEVLTRMQVIAMAIIILGTTIISFEIDVENRFRLRKKTIVLMVSAAFLWAIESVIFKAVALEANLAQSLFWEHLVMVGAGIGIFAVVRSYRSHFLEALRNNSKAIISLNITNELLYIFGNVTVAFAYLLAPIALVLLGESFQPIFVFAIGIFLTIFFPKISVEKIQLRHIWQKFVAISITGIGTYILYIS